MEGLSQSEAQNSLHQSLIDKSQLQVNPPSSAEDEGEVLLIEGYVLSIPKLLLTVFLSLISLGVLFVLTQWYTSVKLYWLYKRSSLGSASHVYVHTKFYHTFLPTFYLQNRRLGQLLAFKHQQIIHIFESGKFSPVSFESNITFSDLLKKYQNGYKNSEDISNLQDLYGKCMIEVPIEPLYKMYGTAMFTPFFFFQVFSFCVWFYEEYWLFAVFIIVLTFFSISYSIFQSRSSMKSLDSLAKHERPVTVHRETIKVINSSELVPGDLIEIPQDGEMPCDVALISGTCIMNEGMLTGESLPVLKDSIENYLTLYSVTDDKKNTLYEGTKVLRTRSFNDLPPMGIVMRTGYNTLKGKIIRSILYPKPSEFKFYEDSVKFIIILCVLAVTEFVITFYKMMELRETNSDITLEGIILKCCDLLTITVPPSLPATMTIGTAFAVKRLSNNKILCINSSRINIAGKIDVVCFDKTGTLTEDGVKLVGIQVKDEYGMCKNMAQLHEINNPHFIECLASCQSLVYMNEKLIGDPQEIEIFEKIDWKLVEEHSKTSENIVKSVVKPPNGSFSELGILKIFHFTSKLKRMGTIVQNLSSNSLRFYTKGAPEVLLENCDPRTVPNELHYILASYTNNGYRVLACAYKDLSVFDPDASLEDVEKGSTFLGLIIMQNLLKRESLPAVKELHKAKIRTIMSTGDAILTGIYSARESHILRSEITVYTGEISQKSPYWEEILYPEDLDRNKKHKILESPPWRNGEFNKDAYVLAITGSLFAKLVHDADTGSEESKRDLEIYLEHCNVYARMSPEHKTLLVQRLHARGYLVAMCGDGTNDCGALKSADIGISLSEADSSIAAPFTSKISNISSVLTILKEGRCALAISVQCFKYMCLYSMIQSSTVTILYWFGQNLSNGQYLTFDLVTVLPLGIFIAYTLPYHKLSVQSPSASLVTVSVLLSIAGQYLLVTGVQICALVILNTQNFYQNKDDQKIAELGEYFSYENTVLFYVSWTMYQTVCVAISTGKPWKKPAYSNYLLLGTHIVLGVITVYTFVWPGQWLRDLVTVVELSDVTFKVYLVLICIGYAILALILERIIVPIVQVAETRKHKHNAVENY